MHNNGTVEKPTTTASEERLEWPETGRNSRSMAKAAGAAREMDRHSDRLWPYGSTSELETQSRTETDKDGDGVRNGVMAEQRRQITDDRTTPEGAGQRRNRTTTGRSNQTTTERLETAGMAKHQPDRQWLPENRQRLEAGTTETRSDRRRQPKCTTTGRTETENGNDQTTRG